MLQLLCYDIFLSKWLYYICIIVLLIVGLYYDAFVLYQQHEDIIFVVH